MARKILVIDDDPNALRLVSYALRAEGYEVNIASSGADALARLASELPDLIILDVMMPDMSGLEVCQRIRANPASARLPVLMLSARGLVADRISGLKSGADDYLPKPADTGELVARVEALLSRATLASAAVAPVAAVAQRAQVLAFTGCKGGVGTTTVAVNVAAHLAEQGKSVCLVELRAGAGSLAALLKLDPTRDLGDLLGKQPAEPAFKDDVAGCVTRLASGLRVVPAPRSGEPPCEILPELVDALSSHLQQGADYLIYDLPAAWTPYVQAAVRQARFTAVICEPEPWLMPCTKAALATLQQWGLTGDVVGAVAVNHGSNPNPMLLAALRSALSTGIAAVIPPAGDAMQIAAREGVPLSTIQPRHVASVALRELAGRLSQPGVRPL